MSRIVWFIRNVDFAKHSLDEVVGAYRAGHRGGRARARARRSRPRRTRGAGRRARRPGRAGRAGRSRAPHRGAAGSRRRARHRARRRSGPASPCADIAAHAFRRSRRSFQLGALIGAAREIAVSDYFDRLALDRAIDSIAPPHRKLTAEVGRAAARRAAAVEAWSEARGADVSRIRAAVDNIVASGLTLSKVTVAASLLGDLREASEVVAGERSAVDGDPAARRVIAAPHPLAAGQATLGSPETTRRRRACVASAIVGWLLFDWACQPFFTLVTTFVFAPYFASALAPDPVDGQSLWGYATAAAGLVLALLFAGARLHRRCERGRKSRGSPRAAWCWSSRRSPCGSPRPGRRMRSRSRSSPSRSARSRSRSRRCSTTP